MIPYRCVTCLFDQHFRYHFKIEFRVFLFHSSHKRNKLSNNTNYQANKNQTICMLVFRLRHKQHRRRIFCAAISLWSVWNDSVYLSNANSFTTLETNFPHGKLETRRNALRAWLNCAVMEINFFFIEKSPSTSDIRRYRQRHYKFNKWNYNENLFEFIRENGGRKN